jgi:predicted ATP-grasp superfamily ATP-dependent carboligase
VWVLWEQDDRIATASRYARRSLPLGRAGEPLHEVLTKLADAQGIAGWTLFPTSDWSAAAVSRAHEDLARVFRMTTSPWEVLRLAHDKRLLYRLAADVGVDHPWTVFPANRADVATLDCEFPVILKPAFREELNRFTMAKAWRVDEPRALLARYDEASRFLSPDGITVQEVIPGGGQSQLSFACLCDHGQPLASVVARRTRQFPHDFGRASTFVETIEEPDVVAAARRILAAIGATGLVEVEFKRDSRTGALKLLDVNPRAWGWHSLGARAGVDFPYLLWLFVHGHRVRAIHGSPGVRWKRLSWDLMAIFSELRRGRFPLREYMGSFRGPRVAAIFAADDPVPGLLEFPLLVYILCSRIARGDAV